MTREEIKQGGVKDGAETKAPPLDAFCVLELMGHIRLAGKVSEETHFGVVMGRIDVPLDGDKWLTQFFGGSAVFRCTPCDEATARAVAANTAAAPVHSYEMPQLARRITEEEESEQRDFPDDDTPY